jgi:hypothetical protein
MCIVFGDVHASVARVDLAKNDMLWLTVHAASSCLATDHPAARMPPGVRC